MRVAGTDEAGRGPLAGPVVAAAVVFPEGYQNPEIKDSKKLSAKKREYLIDTIKRDALSWSVIAVGHRRIDKINILEASKLAMILAVKRVNADMVLVDGNQPLNINIPQECIIGGDAKYVQISAASILAKVWRDELMVTLDRKYPGYSLGAHAGYPTASHREAIAQLGPSPIHRTTFKGVREHLHLLDTIRSAKAQEALESQTR